MGKAAFTPNQVRDKRDAMLATALCLASKPGGWVRLTRGAIASDCGCSPALVSHYCGSMASIHRILVKLAIKQSNNDLLIQAYAAGHPDAIKLKLRAFPGA